MNQKNQNSSYKNKKILPRIQAGYQNGMLTVIEKTEKRKHNYVIWNCRCECGKQIELDTRCLQRGAVRDCGCQQSRPRDRDLRGKRFGLLVCLELLKERDANNRIQWRCICDCGKECTAADFKLLSGHKKSCGCLSQPPMKDYIGRQFGSLTVTEYAGKKDGMHRWRCRCECGTETIVGQMLLQNGKTKSCGCRKAKKLADSLKICEGSSIVKLESSMKQTYRNNTSGHTGVYQNKRTGRWIAQITFKKKTYYLGSYETIEDAIEARKSGESVHKDFVEWYYKRFPLQTAN